MDYSEQPVLTNPTPMVMTRPPPHLPTELKAQIIREVVTFPDGFHGDQQDLVNKFSLLNHGMSTLVSESLYKTNKVIIRPTAERPNGTTIDGPEIESYGYLAPFPGTPPSNIRPYITYPTVAQSQHVRELEFHFDVMSAGFNPTYYIRDQVAWLRRLASGELGFPSLDSLRIVFDYKAHFIGKTNIPLQIYHPDVEIVRFSNVDVTVVVDGHICTQYPCYHRWKCECPQPRHGESETCELTHLTRCGTCYILSETFKTAQSEM